MGQIAKQLLSVNVNRIASELEIQKIGIGIIVVEHPFLPKTIFSRFQEGGLKYQVHSFLGFTREGNYKYRINRLDQNITSDDKQFFSVGNIVYRVGGIAYLAPIPHPSTSNIERFDHELFNPTQQGGTDSECVCTEATSCDTNC